MGCFFTACFGTREHREGLTNVPDDQKKLCTSNELNEAVKILAAAAAAESMKGEQIVSSIKLISESEVSKNEEQINCNNENKAPLDNSNENGKLVEKKMEKDHKDDENGHEEILIIDKERVVVNSKEVELDASSKEDCVHVQQESSESLFSLSIDSRKQAYAVEIGEKEEVSSSPLKPCDAENALFGPKKVFHLLENSALKYQQDKENVNLEEREIALFGPKTVVYVNLDEKDPKEIVDVNLDEKENTLFGPEKIVDFLVDPLEYSSLEHHEDKENVNKEGKWSVPSSKGPVIKQSKPASDNIKPIKEKENEVETSLSSWLVETSIGNSPESEKTYGDTRGLGAISLQQLNESSSPGSAPSCSGDDQPGIGTVGRYWLHTGLAGQVKEMGLSTGSGSHIGMPTV